MTQLESALRTTCAECQSAIVLNADNVRKCGCDVLWPRDTLKAFAKWTLDGEPRFNVLLPGFMCDRGHHTPCDATERPPRDREWIVCRTCHPALSDEQATDIHCYGVEAFASRPFTVAMSGSGAFFFGAKRCGAFSYEAARYARGKVLVKPLDNRDGFKGRTAYLLDALSARFTNRERGYILSAAGLRKLLALHTNGYEAHLRFPGQPPSLFKSDAPRTELTLAAALAACGFKHTSR